MVYDAWQYRDPMEVAIRREEMQQRQRERKAEKQRCQSAQDTCAGCVHEHVIVLPAGKVGRCDRDFRHGWRCAAFVVSEKGNQ